MSIVQRRDRRSDPARPFVRDDPILGQMAIKSVDPHRTLPNQKVPRFIEYGVSVPLIDGFHPDEPHRRSGHSLGDRFRIGGVSLTSFHIRLHISGRHKPHFCGRGR